MKKLYSFLTLMLLAAAAYAQPTNGLVAHWNFNNNTNDASGNGHHGTPTNITYVAGKTGAANTAAKFSGNSYVTVPASTDFNFSRYTICAQILIDSFNTYYCQNSVIIRRGPEKATGSWGMQLFDNAYDSSCTITGDTSHFTFAADAATNNYSVPHGHWQYSPATRTKNWYCVVASFDSTQFKVYVDGVLMSTAFPNNGASPIGTSNDNVVIGANLWGNTSLYPYWLYGVIDDIKVYNRVLSDTEVMQTCYGLPLAVDPSFTDTLLCIGKSFNLSFATSRTYNANNVFTAELSDANGSFASPTTIGTLNAQSSGSIPCFIPSNTPAGTGYRVRVLSSSPAEMSSDNGFNISLQTVVIPTVVITSSPSGSVPQLTPVTFSSFVANGGSNPTFQWKKNGINIPGATGSQYSAIAGIDFTTEDIITLQVTTSLQCAEIGSVQSNEIKTEVTTVSVDGINSLAQNILVYPNPNKGAFTLKGIVAYTENIDLTILNAIGQMVYKETISPSGNKLEHQINIGNNLPAGTYIIRLQSNKSAATKRFTITR